MRHRAISAGEFYRQLGLLVRSDLPLPESLREISAAGAAGPARAAIRELAEHTAKGGSLADGMARYPRVFPEFHVRLIRAGEKTGTLSEALFAVANTAYFNHYLLIQARQVFLYPAITLSATAGVLLFFFVAIVPAFARMYDEMLPGEPLPGLTLLVFHVGRLVNATMPVSPWLCAAVIVCCLGLLTGTRTANRALLALLRALPGAAKLARTVEAARLSSLLSVFLHQHVPVRDALETAADLVENRRLRGALHRVASRHASGDALAAAMAEEEAIEKLVVFAVKQAPEDELPQELERLAELYERWAQLTSRSLMVFWEMLAIVLVTVAVGVSVIAMFLPLIKLVDVLGG